MARTYEACRHTAGTIRNLGKGDVILFIPGVHDMGKYWDAIGVAVLRGAELRIIHAGD